MKRMKTIFLVTIALLIGLRSKTQPGKGDHKSNDSSVITINLKGMKYTGSVDERYQSYNVEMAEVVGGDFWRPYKTMDSLPSLTSLDMAKRSTSLFRKLPPINLADKRLVNLAKALAPAYVRVSGSWANTVYFQDNDSLETKAPQGFVNTLTRGQWKGVIDFIKATDSKLVTSFAVSKGVRDTNEVWTTAEAQKIVNYTKSIGGEIAGAELFNEPTIPFVAGVAYNGGNFAKDEAVFRQWAKREVPGMLLIGPGSTAEGLPAVPLAGLLKNFISTDTLMSATPRPVFDVFSYHYYGAVSMRLLRDNSPLSIKPENALNAAWLQRTNDVADYYIRLRDKYNPGKPIWITETAEASAGGDPFAATYLDCFRYLYQLGSLAEKGIQVVMHNTLAASEYSLIDQDTHLPKPNYWAALLWAKLMGTKVYTTAEGTRGVYVFAHDMKRHKGGITILVLNTNKNSAAINIPSAGIQYTLTSDKLQSETVFLNGQELKLGDDDSLPIIKGREIIAGTTVLPPVSITFITFENAGK
ncbi:MAG TPA: hypothetical protein VG738_17385 [Chitinophagaceae bacterium]|nr:hypothetical protein [Chitinophagaceae bacterium]